MAQSIKIMFAIAIFITHALQGYVPVEIIWHTYLDQKIHRRKIFWEYVCRTIITLATCKSTFSKKRAWALFYRSPKHPFIYLTSSHH